MGNTTITSIEEAVRLINDPDFKKIAQMPETASPEISIYRHNFGVWFRGQHCGRDLTPSLFRRQGTDEESMIYHFMVQAAHSSHRCTNSLDWLCLMRHFELPSRLLDWTENLLVALFFAVKEGYDEQPGYLFVLNARTLNEITRQLPGDLEGKVKHKGNRGIAAPWSVDTALRAEMSRARSKEEFLDQIESFNRNYVEDAYTFRLVRKYLRRSSQHWDFLALPIAVFPNRLDSRMLLQQSVFTLHGGKQYREAEESGNVNLLPGPMGLEKLQQKYFENPFLLCVEVKNKADIREHLRFLGIHEASLFPELDRLSSYLAAQWGPPREEYRAASL